MKPLGTDKRAVVKEDIRDLQTAQDPDIFTVAANLFLKKWHQQCPNLISYFREQWLNKHRERYEGAAVGYPATNNGLEATNSWIKRGHTLRERLLVDQFLRNVLVLICKGE